MTPRNSDTPANPWNSRVTVSSPFSSGCSDGCSDTLLAAGICSFPAKQVTANPAVTKKEQKHFIGSLRLLSPTFDGLARQFQRVCHDTPVVAYLFLVRCFWFYRPARWPSLAGLFERICSMRSRNPQHEGV